MSSFRPAIPEPGRAWFRAGTRVMTLRGEVAAEQVRVGDRALTLSGEGAALKPVAQVELLLVDLDSHPDPILATPVRVCAGAIELGVPLRDLVVAPGHAVALEDADGLRVLVPAQYLVNGATVRREPARGMMTYVAVALEAHDMLMADGMGAESAVAVPPPSVVPLRANPAPPPVPTDLTPREPAYPPCVPMRFGADAAALHALLLARATSLGWGLTEDPAFTLLADDAELEPLSQGDGEFFYLLPPGCSALRLRSRSTVPGEYDPANGDPRHLGVPVAALLHDGAELALDGPAPGAGFLPPEGSAWRWTDGDALVNLPPCDREASLELRLHLGWTRYWLPPPADTPPPDTAPPNTSPAETAS